MTYADRAKKIKFWHGYKVPKSGAAVDGGIVYAEKWAPLFSAA